jgi:hypothetical protein
MSDITQLFVAVEAGDQHTIEDLFANRWMTFASPSPG